MNYFVIIFIFFSHIVSIILSEFIPGITYTIFLYTLLIIIVILQKSRINKTIVFQNPMILSLTLMLAFVVFSELFYGIKGREFYTRDFLIIYGTGTLILLSLRLKNINDFEKILNAFLFGSILSYFVLFFILDISSFNFAYNRDLINEENITFNTITFGRLMGFIFVISLYKFLISKVIYERLISILLVLLSTYYIFVTGTRGVFVAIVFSFSILILVNLKTQRAKYYLTALLIILFIFSMLFNFDQYVLFDRLARIQRIGYENETRYIVWYASFTTILNNYLEPLGPAGFLQIYKNYPHNLILELLTDYGFFALIIIPMLIIYGFKKSIRIFKRDYNNNSIKIIPLLWIYYFFNTMFSGDVIVNQIWFLLSFLLVVAIHFQENSSTTSIYKLGVNQVDTKK